MNKENQKKYDQYKKDKARADKLYATKDKALLEHAAVSSALAAAIEKLTNKWQPKLTKADKKADEAMKAYEELHAKLKETRKSFMSQDNPDRKELIKLILE